MTSNNLLYLERPYSDRFCNKNSNMVIFKLLTTSKEVHIHYMPAEWVTTKWSFDIPILLYWIQVYPWLCDNLVLFY